MELLREERQSIVNIQKLLLLHLSLVNLGGCWSAVREIRAFCSHLVSAKLPPGDFGVCRGGKHRPKVFCSRHVLSVECKKLVEINHVVPIAVDGAEHCQLLVGSFGFSLAVALMVVYGYRVK
jgi:hypothetical protein